MMKNWFIWWCALVTVGFICWNYYGYYPTSYDTVPKAPSVKTIRNNPAAFRSFAASGFTGK